MSGLDEEYDAIDELEDDTEPGEYGNSPEACEMCMMLVSEDDAVKTTNRDLFQVNVKKWLSPICEYHTPERDMEAKANLVLEIAEYAGDNWVAEALQVGVITPEELYEAVSYAVENEMTYRSHHSTVTLDDMSLYHDAVEKVDTDEIPGEFPDV